MRGCQVFYGADNSPTAGYGANDLVRRVGGWATGCLIVKICSYGALMRTSMSQTTTLLLMLLVTSLAALSSAQSKDVSGATAPSLTCTCAGGGVQLCCATAPKLRATCGQLVGWAVCVTCTSHGTHIKNSVQLNLVFSQLPYSHAVGG